ncbi:rod shape-determining protein MreD [Bacillus tuaregi]|uniref:rod shape-determining protein MreD n=1 Tax=Bacillus tuaregi TaxID=1816695 RepID=UPI0008F82711|nr:rod shape-determining protein MreD [Bacillus tuaregi]
MRKVFLPLIISLCFLFESIFVELMTVEAFVTKRIVVPHFLIVAIIFTIIYGNRKHGLMYGFIFGLLFDVVYTEIIGIYLFMLPLVAYIASKIMKVLQTNVVIVSFVALLGVALLELGVYEMNFIIDRTNMVFSRFVEIRLLPTLILNLIFTVLIAFPLKKFLESYAEALRND